jgi:hypothetical protein
MLFFTAFLNKKMNQTNDFFSSKIISLKSPIFYECWHNIYPLIAIASANGVVSVFNENGDKSEEINFSRSVNPTIVNWNPLKIILVTGWKDG